MAYIIKQKEVTVKSRNTSQGNRYKFKIEVWYNGNNIENNTSNITIKTFIATILNATGWYQFRTPAMTRLIDRGNGWENLGSTTMTEVPQNNAGNWVQFGEWTGDISHNADGTKNINCLLQYRSNTTSYDYLPADTDLYTDSFALPTIPRASTMTLPTFTLGSAGTITITRASDTFKHDLIYSEGTIATNVGTSYSWTPPMSLASKKTDGSSFALDITCKTYSGSTLIGSKTQSATFNIPNNANTKPSVSASLQDTTGLYSLYGAYVAGKSQIVITPTFTFKYGATLKKWWVSYGGGTGGEAWGEATQSTTSASMTITPPEETEYITVHVTDSRNFTNTVTYNVSVASYSIPNITQFECERDENNPRTINCFITASITNINNANVNTNTYTLQYKTASSENYTTVATFTGYDLSQQPYQIINTSEDDTYDIILIATDSFESFSRADTVGTSFTLINFSSGGRGMAFGKASEQEDLIESDIDFIFNKNVEVDQNATLGNNLLDKIGNSLINSLKNSLKNEILQAENPIGHVIVQTTNVNPNTYLGFGTWERINGYYPYFGNGYNKTTYTGKNTQSHKLTANQSGLRSHSHPINTSKAAANANTWNDKVKCADGGSAWNFNTHNERSILNEGPWDAIEGHSHNIATVELYAWVRTA